MLTERGRRLGSLRGCCVKESEEFDTESKEQVWKEAHEESWGALREVVWRRS